MGLIKVSYAIANWQRHQRSSTTQIQTQYERKPVELFHCCKEKTLLQKSLVETPFYKYTFGKKNLNLTNSDPLVKPFLTILPNLLQREFSSKSISLNILSASPPLKSKRGQSAERVFFLSLQVPCSKSPRLHLAFTQKSKE